MCSRGGRLVGVALVLLGLATRAAAAPVVLRSVGEVSPLGWPYSLFTEGVIDRTGRLVFAASSTGIFQRSGTLHQRIGAGTMLADGREIVNVGAPTLADDGCVITRAEFGTGGQALVRACSTTPEVLVDGGTAVPGGGVVRAFDPSVVVRGTDVIAFVGTLNDGTTVVERSDPSGLLTLARSGAPAPTGGTFSSFRVLGVLASGAVGFNASVSNGPDGLFVGRDTGLSPVVVTGQGSPAGGSFSDIGTGSINGSDHWAFRATLSTGESGIFTADTTGPAPILGALVRQGAAAPLGSATIRGFASSVQPSINAAGAVAFRALLDNGPSGAGSAAFVAAANGALSLLVATRVDVGGHHVINRLRDPVLADDGTAVVSAGVLGEGPVLYVASAGQLTPLASLGDATDADTGNSRYHFAAASVRATAAGAVILGQRDALFRTEEDGSVSALAYAGAPSPLGGIFAMLGSPQVDGRGSVYFGADLQAGKFNEGLFVTSPSGVKTFLSPDRRLLGGGGIEELFPTDLDTLGRPSEAARGVVLSAALKGAKSAEAVFAFQSRGQAIVVARSGGTASGQRLAAFGTPTAGKGGRVAMLAQFGRDTRRTGLVLKQGGGVGVVTALNASTGTRVGGVFGDLGPPAVARRGAVFRGVLTTKGIEGIFIGKGGHVGVLAASGDKTADGATIRSVDDPIAVDDDVYFLARVAGSVSPPGLYHVQVSKIPAKTDAPLPIDAVLLPGATLPAPTGGVVVNIATPRIGPGGLLTAVVDVGAGSAPSALVQIDRTVP
jgi:hypothetical protein